MYSFQQSGYETIGSGACTVIRGNLRIQCASSAVANSRGGPIANLTFLSSLSSVLGYVHIENCNDITTLSPLGTDPPTPIPHHHAHGSLPARPE